MANDDLSPPEIQNGGTGSVSAGKVTAPDYRQLQAPAEGLQPWRLANDHAAQRAEALSSAFKDFEGVAGGIYKNLATKAGQQAGAAAGLDPNFKPKTGLQAVTAYGQAYDAAAHQTYVTSSQLALEQQLSDIEQKSVGDPDSFATQASGAVQGALKNMDPLYVPEMTNWAQARIQAGVNRQSQQKAADVRNEALATYQSATPDLITSALHTAAALPNDQGDAVISKLVSDDQDRLNALVASRTITPEQAVTLHQKMVADAHNQMSGQKVDLSLQPVLQAMRGNVEAADKLIVQPDPNLTPDENHIRLQEFEKDRAEYVQSQTHARADDLNTIHQALAAGQYGPEVEGSIHSLYKQGALSEEGYFAATAESIRNQKAGIEHDASLQLVDAAVHGTGPRLDPKDPASQEAADQYFKAHVAQSGNVGDAQYGVGASEFVRQTGIVPKSVQSQIRVGLLSGDPDLTARAATLAAKISKENPDAQVYVGTPRLAALAGLVSDNISAGLSTSQAYQMARAQVDISPEQRKIRDQHYSADLKAAGPNQTALATILNKQDGGLFAAKPPTPPVGMQAQYESLTHQFYDQTGDLAKSRELAAGQLRQTWGISHVNGAAEYTQYPIKDADVSTVRADIATAAKAAGYNGDPSALHLTPNANTVTSHGRTWNVTYNDPQTGAPDVLLGKDNRPQQYTVPTPQDFAKNRQTLIDQKLAAARKERDMDRANSADVNKYEQQLANEMLAGNAAQRRQAGR